MQIVSAHDKSVMSKQDMIEVIKAYVQEARTLNRQKTGMEEHEMESAHEEQDEEDKQQWGVEEDGRVGRPARGLSELYLIYDNLIRFL